MDARSRGDARVSGHRAECDAHAKDTEDDKSGRARSGADDYLTKPFGAPELIDESRADCRARQAVHQEGHYASFTTGDCGRFQQHQALRQATRSTYATEYRIPGPPGPQRRPRCDAGDLLTKVGAPPLATKPTFAGEHRALGKGSSPSVKSTHVDHAAGIGYSLPKLDPRTVELIQVFLAVVACGVSPGLLALDLARSRTVDRGSTRRGAPY